MAAKEAKTLIIVTWFTTLLVSALPIILWRELAGGEPYWWPWITSFILLSLILSTFILGSLKQIQDYLIILGIIFFLGYSGGWNWGLISLIRDSSAWINLINVLPWFLSAIALHILRLLPAILILIYSFTKGYKLKDLYLIKGNINSLVQPSRLLGIKEKTYWTKVAPIFALIFTFGTLLFLILSTKLPSDYFSKLLYAIPFGVIVAVINGFNEEFTLRAAPISRIEKALPKNDALLITTAFFGIGHYYGVPNGVIGVLLSSFLGWFLGKSILETKGFFWAWLIHILPDIIIFTFYALGAL